MARKHTAPKTEAEAKLAGPGTVGQLEALAGIAADHESRRAFWSPFCHLPGEEAFAAFRARCYALIQARVDAGELCLI